MRYVTPNFTDYNQYKKPKLKTMPLRMQYTPAWPIGDLRVYIDRVSMSMDRVIYYLTHQEELLDILARGAHFAETARTDEYYLSRNPFANQRFDIHSGAWNLDRAHWLTPTRENNPADSLLISSFDFSGEHSKHIGTREYVCTDIYNDMLQRANAEGQSRLEKVTREKKRLQKERDEIEKRIEHLEELEARYAARQAEKAEQKKHPRRGYVYLLNEVNGDHYKIGRTRNPDNRLHTFSVKLPYQVEYAHLIATEDMYTLEADLHARYAHCRVDGEWFALTPDEVAEIKLLGEVL